MASWRTKLHSSKHDCRHGTRLDFKHTVLREYTNPTSSTTLLRAQSNRVYAYQLEYPHSTVYADMMYQLVYITTGRVKKYQYLDPGGRLTNKQTTGRVKKYQYLVCILVEQQYAILVCTLHTFVVCIVCILAWCVRSEVHKRKICKLSQLLLQYYNAKNTEQASHVFMTIYMVRIPSFMVRIP